MHPFASCADCERPVYLVICTTNLGGQFGCSEGRSALYPRAPLRVVQDMKAALALFVCECCAFGIAASSPLKDGERHG